MVLRRDVFEGGGSAREAARAFDWARTGLGTAESWSEHAWTITDLCLSLDSPAMLCWGNELIQIYNDPCCALLGPRHPGAMGQSARDCWAPLWDSLSSGYERLAARGEVARARAVRLPTGPDGSPTETSYDLSFVPVRDAAGDVAAVLIVATDVTGSVTWARRTRLVARTAAKMAVGRTERAVCEAAAAELVAGEPHVTFALIYLFEGTAAKLSGSAGLSPGGPLAPPQVVLRDRNGGWDDPWGMAGMGARGHEVRLDAPREPSASGGDVPRARDAFVRPLVPPGTGDSIGALVIGVLDGDRDGLGPTISASVAEVIAASVQAVRRRAELRWRCDELEAEIESRSRYTASVSHELRTPLNAILAHAELLAEGFLGQIEPRQAKHVDRIATAAAQLLGLVDEILELSRSGREVVRLTIQETDLGRLVGELEELLRPLFRAKGLEFNVRIQEGLRPIRTDGAKVRQILINLLSNAQKYTDVGGVELVVSQSGDGSISVSVMDTGRGIDEEDQPSVFEPFWRVQSAGETVGTGLGLNVAQSLARLLGGAVAVRSRPGVGSTFTLHVPDVGPTQELSGPRLSPPA